MTTDLLETTLQAIGNAAEAYLQNLERRGDRWIVLSNLTQADGTPVAATEDKIVMTVCNLAQEMVIGIDPTPGRGGDSANAYRVASPPLYLDVHLMFAVNFPRNYATGLGMLSRLIGFFQQTPFFDHQNTPTLDPMINKITLEMENLGPAELGQVVAMHGGRYLPSVFYKLRMLPFTGAFAVPRPEPTI